jgi:hypothetical protein
MTTIVPRNRTARIAELKASLTRCRVYTLENLFAGSDTDPAHAWAALYHFNSARLHDCGDGTFTVHVHGNRWYELAPGAGTVAKWNASHGITP